MKTFWLAGAITVGIIDYWCHRTHHLTLSKAIAATIPEWLLYALIGWFLWHMRNMYHRLT